MPPVRSTSSLAAARSSSITKTTATMANNNNNKNNSPVNNTVLKRTASNMKAQNLASSVANAFARTNSNMAQAAAQLKKQQQQQEQQEQIANNNAKQQQQQQQRSSSNSKSTEAEKLKKKEQKQLRQEEDKKIIGSAFDPIPDDVNLDDAIDDLLPRPSKAPARLHLRGHGDAVKSCCFDPHHRLLFTASWDGLVLVWNLEAQSSTPVARLQHREWVNAVATTYVPDLTVVSVTEDGYLFAWQCEEFMIEKNINNAPSLASTVQKVNNNNNNDNINNHQLDDTHQLLAESHQKKFEIVAQIQVAFGALTCLVIHSDYNFAFCSSGDTTFGIHLSSGSILREYVTSSEAMALATVDAVLCIAQRNGSISLYDVVGSFILRELTGHQGPVRCLSVVDAYTIMSAGEDMSVRVWNLASGTCQSNRRRVHNRPIVAISHFYTDRDRMVVTAGLDASIKVTRQSNGVTVANFGVMCSCFCIVPPIAVDASNVDDVVEMLTAGKLADEATEAEKKMFADANNNNKSNNGGGGNAKEWGDDDDEASELPTSPTSSSSKMKTKKAKKFTTKKTKNNNNNKNQSDDDEIDDGDENDENGEGENGGGGMVYTATAVFDMRQATSGHGGVGGGGAGAGTSSSFADDGYSASLSSPLTIPGTGRVIRGQHVSRHARWSFFQTLVSGGPTGRVTRLSLEGAISKDSSSGSSATRMAFHY